MKKLLHKIINKLGYGIYKKNKEKIAVTKKLAKFKIFNQSKLLYECSNCVFIFDEIYDDFKINEVENYLEISFKNLVFYIESKEEFLILKEIFIEKEYNFIVNEDCVLIDIGTNVGMASIFFSQFDFIHKIYAFEPVKDTFEIANKNFKANKISKIVEFYNFGLGKEVRDEQFLFRRQAKGNSGIRGKLSYSFKNRNDIEFRTVNIKNATKTLSPIIAENKSSKIVIKMDCEGAEYEILNDLNENNILGQIAIIILEWHDYGPTTIENYLKNNNFTTFSRNLGTNSGMIYAVKN